MMWMFFGLLVLVTTIPHTSESLGHQISHHGEDRDATKTSSRNNLGRHYHRRCDHQECLRQCPKEDWKKIAVSQIHLCRKLSMDRFRRYLCTLAGRRSQVDGRTLFLQVP
ncbi:hypothetical protein IW262DRAFT_562237 [Armillaria fumosa]|nr:hypothetical protein IW262DRAFT_562237 [Armillaria fumosa]